MAGGPPLPGQPRCANPVGAAAGDGGAHRRVSRDETLQGTARTRSAFEPEEVRTFVYPHLGRAHPHGARFGDERGAVHLRRRRDCVRGGGGRRARRRRGARLAGRPLLHRLWHRVQARSRGRLGGAACFTGVPRSRPEAGSSDVERSFRPFAEIAEEAPRGAKLAKGAQEQRGRSGLQNGPTTAVAARRSTGQNCASLGRKLASEHRRGPGT
mmetsp:Transcript_5018/g.15874  ORF Transcript_5018/g.15874 Transcript_5018/m.15874 type:complete len:212 (+) Transcript_5018:333-968(+)